MRYSLPESFELEFHKAIPKNNQIIKTIKTIIGFCNQRGGKIIFGIDNDGTIVGVDDDGEVIDIMRYLEKAVLNATFPPILTHSYLQRIGTKTLLFLEVARGMDKPFYLKKDGKINDVYIRLGRRTVKANEDIIRELRLELLIGLKKQKFSDDELKILDLFISTTDISVSDLIDVLHFPRPTATRRLAELVRKKTH